MALGPRGGGPWDESSLDKMLDKVDLDFHHRGINIDARMPHTPRRSGNRYRNCTY